MLFVKFSCFLATINAEMNERGGEQEGHETEGVELEEHGVGAGQSTRQEQGTLGNCVDKRMCAGRDIVIGWHKCGQCQKPLCNLCSGKEDDDDMKACPSGFCHW